MKFYRPYLKKRSDNSKPKTNKYFGTLDDLFESYTNKINFHFFSDEYGLKHKKAWKIILNESSEFDENQMIKELSRVEGRDNIENNVSFLNAYGIELEYIIFYDHSDWNDNDGVIYKLSFKMNEDKITYSRRRFSKNGFRNYLLSLQGERMIMNKRLIYSNTELEGYLADLCYRNNDGVDSAIFPGDIDLVLYEKNKAKFILEFKKHTIIGPISEQSFVKYYYQDRKKYLGIASVAKELNQKEFYNIIYSTNQDDNKIKIEVIDIELNIKNVSIIEFSTKEELLYKLKDYFNKQKGDLNE